MPVGSLLGLLRGEPVTRTSLATLLTVQTVLFLIQALLNKSALSDLPAPLMLLLLESGITAAAVYAGHLLGYYELRTTRHVATSLRSLRWLILSKVASAVTRIYCLEAVDGAVFNLVRGLVLPFAVVLSALFLDRKPSVASLIPVAAICAGFYIGTFSEHTDLGDVGGVYGVSMGALSSFFAALDLTITKTTLSKHGLYDILYVTNAATVLVTLPMILLGTEYDDHLQLEYRHPDLQAFLFKAVVCGILTFLTAVLALLQLNLTSPITHQITTSARGVLQSLLSVVFLGESMPRPQVVSVGIILTGTVGYTYIKDVESRNNTTTTTIGSGSGGGKKRDFPSESDELESGAGTHATDTTKTMKGPAAADVAYRQGTKEYAEKGS